MPLRIIRYQLAIIQKHIDKYGEVPLPLVVPLVFYNGSQSPYPYEHDIANLFFNKELFAQVQLGKFRLIDLTIMPKEEILKHGKVAVLEMFAKYIGIRDLKAVLEYIIASIDVAHAHGLSESLFKGAFSYLVDARETGEIKLIVEQLIKTVPEYEEIVMTYAESLRKEGELRGLQEGKLMGLQEGKLKGLREGKLKGLQEGKLVAQKEIAQELLKSDEVRKAYLGES